MLTNVRVLIASKTESDLNMHNMYESFIFINTFNIYIYK